jgi:hypothetical protein
VRIYSKSREGELRHIRASEDNEPGSAQAGDSHGILSGWFGILEDHRTCACHIPGYIEQVLDGDGYAGEKA